MGLVRRALDNLSFSFSATPLPTSTVPNSAIPSSASPFTSASPPTLLSFLSSKYVLSILFCAFLVNRIQSIVPSRTRLRPSTRSNFVARLLRIPSIIIQFRAVLGLIGLLTPQYGTSSWAASGLQTEEEVLWSVFMASSISVLSEAFIRALSDDLSSTGSFNLLSLAVILHSNLITEKKSKQSKNSFYVYLLLNQLELLAVHISYLWSDNFRFIITGASSIISQVHLYRSFNLAIAILPDQGWINRAPEVCFEILTFTTLSLRILSSVLRGELMTVEGIFGERSSWPALSEDYSTGLMKYATGFLEMGLSGLISEVDPIIYYVKLSKGGGKPTIESKLKKDFAENIQARITDNGQAVMGEGIAREISIVECSVNEVPNPMFVRRNKTWFRLFDLAGRVLKEIWRRNWIRIRTLGRKVLRRVGLGRDSWEIENWMAKIGTDGDDSDSDFDGSEEEEGDNSEDEEEGEDEDDLETDNQHLLFADLAKPVNTDHRGIDRSTEILSSIARRTRQSRSRQSTPTIDSSSVSTAILLAHHSSTSPLTRRRYNELLSPFSSDRPPFGAVERREDQERENSLEERETRSCAICYSEERTIILWPCKCLCLCETCREGMATRSRENMSCPCCRTKIDGFSRIYIP